MKEEDVTQYLVTLLRANPFDFESHGYDLHLPKVVDRYMSGHKPPYIGMTEQGERNRMSQALRDSAWELCRRGILRPSVRVSGAQVTEAGSGGDGYTITRAGHVFFQDKDTYLFIPTEIARYRLMLEPFKKHFGKGFYERAIEALQCFNTGSFLACCAMCGAASESILLSAAIAKESDEAKVLALYRSARGRKRIEDLLFGQANEKEYQALFELLKYWRDEAAHGTASGITENEAYSALVTLLRYSSTMHARWKQITKGV